MTIIEVQRLVAAHYKISLEQLLGRDTHPAVAHPRAVAMYIVRTTLKLSYPTIGKAFRKRDHSTVMAACKKIANRAQNQIEDDVDELEAKVRSLPDAEPPPTPAAATGSIITIDGVYVALEQTDTDLYTLHIGNHVRVAELTKEHRRALAGLLLRGL